MIKYLKAFIFYFKTRKTSFWFRESTTEWIYEVEVQTENYYSNSRYSNKVKLFCYFIWLYLFLNTIKDIKQNE